MLNGYKVYIVAVAAVLYAGTQFWAGNMDMNAAIMMVLAALGGAGLRKGMANETKVALAAQGVQVSNTSSVPTRLAAVKDQVKSIAPMLMTFVLIGSLVLGSVTACATPGISPQMELNAVEAGFALAEASYDSICSRANAPQFCADNAVNYAKAKIALEASFQAAQAAIDLSGGVSSAGIQQLILAAQNAWDAYNNIVKSTEVKARAVGMKVQRR